MKTFNAALVYGHKTVAMVSEDDYNETSPAEVTSRLVDDFGSVEMVGYGLIALGEICVKVEAVYIFDKDEFYAVEELDQLTYTVHSFVILDDQD